MGAEESNSDPHLCSKGFNPGLFPSLHVLIFLRDLPPSSTKADSEVKMNLSPDSSGPQLVDQSYLRQHSDQNRNPGRRIQGPQALLKSAAPAAAWCHSAWQTPRVRCCCLLVLLLFSFPNRRATPALPWHTPEQMGT